MAHFLVKQDYTWETEKFLLIETDLQESSCQLTGQARAAIPFNTCFHWMGFSHLLYPHCSHWICQDFWGLIILHMRLGHFCGSVSEFRVLAAPSNSLKNYYTSCFRDQTSFCFLKPLESLQGGLEQLSGARPTLCASREHHPITEVHDAGYSLGQNFELLGPQVLNLEWQHLHSCTCHMSRQAHGEWLAFLRRKLGWKEPLLPSFQPSSWCRCPEMTEALS